MTEVIDLNKALDTQILDTEDMIFSMKTVPTESRDHDWKTVYEALCRQLMALLTVQYRNQR